MSQMLVIGKDMKFYLYNSTEC